MPTQPESPPFLPAPPGPMPGAMPGSSRASLQVLMLAGWAPIACLNTSLWLVLVGVVMIDFAVQAIHVTNQSLIVATRPEASSRLIGVYMMFYSIGSGLGAIASTIVYAAAGWLGVCVLGAAISAVALLYWVIVVSRTPAPVGACSEA